MGDSVASPIIHESADSAHPGSDIDPARTAAFFDVDGTLVATHIVHQYLFIRRFLAQQADRPFSSAASSLWQAGFTLKCLKYLVLDCISRSRMNISFYRNYRGLPVADVHSAAEECYKQVLKPHLFDQAAHCVQQHLLAGHRVVFVTGSIDFLIQPLARELSTPDQTNHNTTNNNVELLARTLLRDGDVFTGELDGPPMGEQQKAQTIRTFAHRERIILAQSYAYGDSIADLPMLEIVGHPVVVNPDRRLQRVAQTRQWPTHQWNRSGGRA
jgi:alcohol-forming fatty acyl-CoA reductase